MKINISLLLVIGNFCAAIANVTTLDLINDVKFNGGSMDVGNVVNAAPAQTGAAEIFGSSEAGAVMDANMLSSTAAEKQVSTAIDSDGPKRHWKIAASWVAKYMKVRTAVRYVYDEIKIWQGVYLQYKDLVRWLDNMKGYVSQTGQNINHLFTEPGTFVEKLEMIVEIDDNINYISKKMPQLLDQRLANIEKRVFDDAFADTFTYQLGPFSHTMGWTPGAIVPNAAEAFDWLSEKTLDNNFVNSISGYWDSVGLGYNNGKPGGFLELDLPDGIRLDDETPRDDPYRSFTLPIMSNTVLISTAVSNSNAYRAWAARAKEQLDDKKAGLEGRLKSILTDPGINAYEFAATWYSIETVNANNKLLRHSIEEAKLMVGILGTDLHRRSMSRELELQHIISVKQSH